MNGNDTSACACLRAYVRVGARACAHACACMRVCARVRMRISRWHLNDLSLKPYTI